MDQPARTLPPASSTESSAPWHTLPGEEVARLLQTSPAVGLTPEEAARRLAHHGPNRLPGKKGGGPLALLLRQFSDFLILILLAAALVAGLLGETRDTFVILLIVGLNAAIGFIQEYRAERALALLQQMTETQARVRRGGHWQEIPVSNVVPGDIAWIEAGNLIPADLRLLEVAQLKVEEAPLTGESITVDKDPRPVADPEAPLGDRLNLSFKGTHVTHGHGIGVVFATGAATEIGRIATLLSTGETVQTPLQKRLARFGRRLGLLVLAIAAIVFVAGLLRREPAGLMLLTAISLAVAAVPEALPAVVAIALALGARNMVRQQALVRRLPAVEALGSVTCICSDKTGTLTQNRMVVDAYWVAGTCAAAVPPAPVRGRAWQALLDAMTLNNDASLQPDGTEVGDPTETALIRATLAAGLVKEDRQEILPRVAELPFEAERKRMTTLHGQTDGRVIAYTKGAPEAVLPLCVSLLGETGKAPLERAAVEAAADSMARQGLRVLAFAVREWDALPEAPTVVTVEADLQFVGLVGLLDPPREGVQEAVAVSRLAGVRPVMITGDHPATACAIATRLGIAGAGDRVLTGKDLLIQDPAALGAQIRQVSVFARVSPEQKIDIVRALQAAGEVVAMTGDGVNDAPALKQADIGVAMGRNGTDVTREAADMILLDDNFATIVAAIREGRRVYANIRNFIRYALTGNVGEILVLLLAPFFGLPIPLLPTHILWINLVTDGLPGLMLTNQPVEEGVMRRPPRPVGESIFAGGVGGRILWLGGVIALLSLYIQHWGISRNLPHWQTLVFTVLSLSQLFLVLGLRTEKEAAWRRIGANPSLLVVVALTLGLQLALLYLPALAPLLDLDPLPPEELGLCVALSLVPLGLVELDKLLRRRAGKTTERNRPDGPPAGS